MAETARIGRNLGAIAFAHVAAQGLAFVVSLAVTRVLGVEPYGIFVFGFAFPSWFVLLIGLGLDYVVTVDVAADRTKASAYLTAVSAVRIPLVLVAILLLWVSLHLAVADPFARTIVMVLGVANILSAYNATFDSLFRAHERLDFTALVMVVERAIATAAVLGLLALGQGLLAISAVYVGSVLVTTALSLVFLRRHFAWFARPLDPSVLRHILRRAPPFALSALVAVLMYSTAPVFLTFLQGPTATGHFNAAFVLLLALMAPLQMYNAVFLPRMARLHRHTPRALPSLLHRTQRLFFAVGLPLALGGAFYADTLLVFLYGEPFRESGAVFAVLAFVLAVTTASLGAGTALGATDRASLEVRYGASGAVLNIGLCLVLIPSMGPLGAAWAFLLSMAAIAVLRLAAMSRLIAPYRFVGTTARAALAGAAMVVVLVTIRPPLFAGIALGAAVYFGALAALRGLTRDDVGILADIVRGAILPSDRLRVRELGDAFRAFAERDCGGRSPFHERLASRVADDRPLLRIAAHAREGQPVPFLFFGAVHYLLLSGRTHVLREYYPDLADRPRTDDPYPVFRAFCLEHARELEGLMASRLVQTNDVQRSSSLLPAFDHVARQAGGKPLALVEIGTSAGLNLLWDRYAFDYGEGRTCGDPSSEIRLTCALRGPRVPPVPSTPPQVAFRIGIDLHPIDLRDPDAALWLRALLEPEQGRAARLLEAAIEMWRDDPPTLVQGDAVDVLPRVLADIPRSAVLCIFHSFVLNQFSPEARERLLSQIAAWGAKRELFLISIEYSWELDRTQIVVGRFDGTSVRESLLGYCDSRGTWLEWAAPDEPEEATVRAALA